MNRFCGITTFVVAAATALVLGVSPSALYAQTGGTIQGRVINAATQQPVEAVQVTVSGTSRGSVTGRDGTYSIENIPAGVHQVRVEFVGYRSISQAVTVVTNQTVTADFEIEQAPIDLGEIVATGVAGQAVRAKLPFTVDRLTQAQLPVPATNAASMIAGKAAGVRVASPSGRPGTAPSILLRGPMSINAAGRDQEPMYIVDGVILASSVVDIDALDIESIEIVKGAAAASLYGSRAANGVIQITTARGKSVADDDVRYTVRTEFGTSDLPGRFNLAQVHMFAMTPDGSKFIGTNGQPCDWSHCPGVSLAGQRKLDPGDASSAWNTVMDLQWPGVTYDHVERFFRGGDYMQNSLTIAGRSGGTNYLVSYNRLNDEGIMPGQRGQMRHNFRINVDQAVHEDITVSASALYSRSKQDDSQGPMFQLTRMPAGVDLLGPDPFHAHLPFILKPDPFNDNQNPLYSAMFLKNDQERGRFLGSITGRWSPLDWFDLDGTVAYDRLNRDDESITPKDFATLSQPNGTGGGISLSSSKIEGLNASIMGQVRRQFGDLNTTTQLRYQIEQDEREGMSASGSQFVVDGVPTIGNTPDDERNAGSSLSTTRNDGVYLITNLDYKDRYIIDALARNDGSSRFGPDERRHWYYRGSVAYRISQEDWFNVGAIDELKLRYSYGTSGNHPRFEAQYETYSVGGGSITPVTLGNRNLKPEFVTEQEMGVDALLFNRISVELTYAKSDADDQILQVPSLAYTGFSSQWQNAGRLESNTIEASIGAQVLRRGDLTWNTRLMFDRTKQKITELNVPAYQTGVGGQGLGNVFFVRAGEALGTFYGFQFAEHCGHLQQGVDCGDFQVNDDGYLVYVGSAGSYENGWQTFINEDGEQETFWGSVSPYADPRGQGIRWGTPFQAEGDDPITGERTTFLPLGQGLPDYTLSFANTLTWKNFSLYGLVESLQGFSVYNQPLQWAVFQNYAGIADESGTPEDLKKPIGYYDRLYGASGLQASSAFVDDASFIKVRELSLRYRAGRSLLDRIPVARGFSDLTLSVTGRNLKTWTDYDGYDPDVGSTGGGVGSAVLARVDGYSYPNFRQFSFGIELSF